MKDFKNVNFIDKNSTYIDNSVKIGKNVTIYPNNYILGNTIIGDNCTIMPFNIIENCVIGNSVTISFSKLEYSNIKDNASIGPFSHLRKNSIIGENCKIGSFVETKNSTINNGTKAKHLAYIGDAVIGKNCNIGCGAIFVSYNGREKNKINVGDNAFIGSNSNLIAPLNIAKNTYICAGSTLTINTNENDFVIARSRETVKPNRAIKYLETNKKD